MHWQYLSQFLPHTTPESLKYKWLSLQQKCSNLPNFWTVKDDYLLMETVDEKAPVLLDPMKSQNFKVKWSMIAMKFNFLSKNNKLGKHCKERWFNHLSPLLNRNIWTDHEDILLLENAIIHNKKWAKIASDFPGRTQHNIKNRFLSLIAREHHISSKKISFKDTCSKCLILKTLCNLKKRYRFSNEKPFDYLPEEKMQVFVDENFDMGTENKGYGLNLSLKMMSSEDMMRKKDLSLMEFTPKWEKNEMECFAQKSETKENDNFLENMEDFNL